MPFNVAVFGIVIAVSLVIGGIITITYVTIEDEKHPDEPVSKLTIASMMIAFVLLGAVVYGVYHIYTATPDPKSKAFITEKEISLFKDSTEYIKNYVAKVKTIPKADLTPVCDSDNLCVGGFKPTPKPECKPCPIGGTSTVPSFGFPAYKPFGKPQTTWEGV